MKYHIKKVKSLAAFFSKHIVHSLFSSWNTAFLFKISWFQETSWKLATLTYWVDYWNSPFYEVLCLGLHRGHILVDLAVALLVDHLSISATMTPSASLAASSLSRSRRRTFSWFAFPKNNKANRRVRQIFISLISFPPKSALEWNCIDKLTSQLNVVLKVSMVKMYANEGLLLHHVIFLERVMVALKRAHLC